MAAKPTDAHVHRFRDRIALSLPGSGETVYLSAKEARRLGRILRECARDVVTIPDFSQSAFSAQAVELERYK